MCRLRFNPRAREGRDQGHDRGAADRSFVSIHAPVRGATLRAMSASSGATSFNPRAREGRDGYAEPGSTAATLFQSTRP